MMTRHFLRILPILASFSVWGESIPLAELRLKDTLETVYNTWRQSIVRGNIQSWESCTASYRKMRVRNQAISEKRPFPQSLFMQPFSPPSLADLKYVGTVISHQKTTCATTYYGKIDWGVGGKPTDNALVLLFVNEGGTWKYDQARYFNLSHLQSTRNRLARGDRKLLIEDDGFMPITDVPPTGGLCSPPQYIAKVFVDCQGRTVNTTINGISPHTFSDTRNAEIILGGVHDGTNSITFNASTLPGKKAGSITICVFIMPETEGNIPGEAFFMRVEPGQELTKPSTTFTITPETIRRMNPEYLKQHIKDLKATPEELKGH